MERKNEIVLVLDFGGQYNQLIARRVRECNVYCEVHPYTMTIDEIRSLNPKGIIFTGGPNSVYEDESPKCSKEIFELGIPILGICYGCQLMAHTLGGEVTAAQDDTAREYGKTVTYYNTDCKLFEELPQQGVSWMSHGDYMAKVPDGFELMAHSDACPNVTIADEKRGFYGVQFHPEVNHTENGTDMIRNFLYKVCGV
ncbi:MAG: glutamine-hydrolyzing GMP synthase, partial [Acutalibacteraceae bacterium]